MRSTNQCFNTPAPWMVWTVPSAMAALSLTSFSTLALLGWPGEYAGSSDMFCEADRPPSAATALTVRQPANTWSSLSFLAAGLGMARYCRYMRERPSDLDELDGDGAQHFLRHRRRPNAFARSTWLQTLYCSIVVSLAPGSMFYHASGTAWAGTMDVVAQIPYASFLAVHAVARALARRASGAAGGAVGPRVYRRRFWVLYPIVTAITSFPRIVKDIDYVGPIAALIALFLLLEFGGALRRCKQLRESRNTHQGQSMCDQGYIYLSSGLSCIILGYFIMQQTKTGAPLCRPRSLIQGHAVWHILSSASAVFVFLFFITNREDAPIGRIDEKSNSHTLVPTSELLEGCLDPKITAVLTSNDDEADVLELWGRPGLAGGSMLRSKEMANDFEGGADFTNPVECATDPEPGNVLSAPLVSNPHPNTK